jgi:hypothetical protein
MPEREPYEKKGVRTGDLVQIRQGQERIWIKITEVGEASLTGNIDSDPTLTRLHGLKKGDEVSFKRTEALDVKEQE